MRRYIGWGGERSILYKGVKISPKQTRFQSLKGKPERKSPKRTIFASDGLGLLQMVSKPDTGPCVSEEAKPRRGVDMRQCANKDEGWIEGSHIDWKREQVPVKTLHPGVDCWDPTSVGEENKAFFISVWKPLPSWRVLKTLLAVGLGCYTFHLNLANNRWAWTTDKYDVKGKKKNYGGFVK